MIEVIDEVVAVADAPVVGAVEGGVKCRVRSKRPEAMKRERTMDGRDWTRIDTGGFAVWREALRTWLRPRAEAQAPCGLILRLGVYE